MNETAKALILANIEAYVDKMIAKGYFTIENRESAIQGYKNMARIA